MQQQDSGVVADPLLVNTATAAELLGISKRKLWELTNRRLIPSVRIGTRVLYELQDLRDWIKGQKTRPRQ